MIKFLALILNLYTWGIICTLLLSLFGIARFFEQRLLKKTTAANKRLLYPFFLLPIGFFAASATLYTFSAPTIAGNFWADSFRLAGAVILITAGYLLLNRMMGGRS